MKTLDQAQTLLTHLENHGKALAEMETQFPVKEYLREKELYENLQEEIKILAREVGTLETPFVKVTVTSPAPKISYNYDQLKIRATSEEMQAVWDNALKIDLDASQVSNLVNAGLLRAEIADECKEIKNPTPAVSFKLK